MFFDSGAITKKELCVEKCEIYCQDDPRWTKDLSICKLKNIEKKKLISAF